MTAPMPEPRPNADDAAYWEAGQADSGGRVPVNTHGGMLSHTHVGAAGGMFDPLEGVRSTMASPGPGAQRTQKSHWFTTKVVYFFRIAP